MRWLAFLVVFAASSAAAEDEIIQFLDAVDAPKKPTVIPSEVYDWKVWSEPSAIDDSKNVFMTGLSPDGITDKRGKPYLVTLWIACQENRTVMSFEFGGIFVAASDPYGTMIYRVDKKPAKTVSVWASPDHRNLGLYRKDAIPAMKQMAEGSELLIRATPYGEASSDIHFRLTGFKEKLAEVRRACGW